MIRTMRPADLEAVADIWLRANLEAHDFIPAGYWRGCLPEVREQLPQAEVLVWEEGGEILGFLGLQGEYAAGLFVRRGDRGRGGGRALLDSAKGRRERLRLCVYAKNQGALAFYRREGFRLHRAGTDSATGEREYELIWTREAAPRVPRQKK